MLLVQAYFFDMGGLSHRIYWCSRIGYVIDMSGFSTCMKFLGSIFILCCRFYIWCLNCLNKFLLLHSYFLQEADLILGGDEGKECTYGKGYVKRQAIFSCLTCTPDGNAGVCTACSLVCHDGHEVCFVSLIILFIVILILNFSYDMFIDVYACDSYVCAPFTCSVKLVISAFVSRKVNC